MLDRQQILTFLKSGDPASELTLWQWADRCRKEAVGNEVHIRALLEIGNVCQRNCHYCGLRKGNDTLQRYRMPLDEILEVAMKCNREGYGTLVMQAGEDPHWSSKDLAGVIRAIKSQTSMAITLSLGEQPFETLNAWKQAGANRYILRFETSDAELLQKIHPPFERHQSSFGQRLKTLQHLRELGYEVGSGFMVGIPGQTWSTLVDDLLLLKSLNLDMFGIGNFIPNSLTPLGKQARHLADPEQVPATPELAQRCIAIARLLSPKANIPATSAICITQQNGLLTALQRGANVYMRDCTPEKYRRHYSIYPGKSETTPLEFNQLVEMVQSIGRSISSGQGSSLHFKERTSL